MNVAHNSMKVNDEQGKYLTFRSRLYMKMMKIPHVILYENNDFLTMFCQDKGCYISSQENDGMQNKTV